MKLRVESGVYDAVSLKVTAVKEARETQPAVSSGCIEKVVRIRSHVKSALSIGSVNWLC